MMSAPVRPTAAFVTYDLAALVMLKAAQSLGIRVPDDLCWRSPSMIFPRGAQHSGGPDEVRPANRRHRTVPANVLLDGIVGLKTPYRRRMIPAR